MKEPAFKTEAALCAAFIAWAGQHDGVRCFAEWAGWDILVALPDGLQLGIQAKLRLNAEVIGQAAPDPDRYNLGENVQAPDYRAVLVPASNPLAGIAARLGLVVFHPSGWGDGFTPELLDYRMPSHRHRDPWVDWNPRARHELPATATDSVAGSPCPVTLTHWKLAALDVLAELAVKGVITTKRMRELGVHPGRWTTYRWLEPAETRGDWVRGERCPAFEAQHPTAYAVALEKARAAAA